MDTATAPAEAFIRSRLACKFGSDLSAACDEDNLIADTHFTRNSIDFGDILDRLRAVFSECGDSKDKK